MPSKSRKPNTRALIGASISSNGPQRQSPSGWAMYASRAALEAVKATVEAEPDSDTSEIREAGRIAFMSCMPLITSRSTAKAYICCAAAGVAMQVFSAEEAGKLMYIAQTALSAHRNGGRG